MNRDFDSTVLEAYLRINLIADFEILYDDLEEEIFKEKRTRNRQETVDLWSTVCLPSLETLKKSVDIYSRLGMAGAVFSMDCTHVYLDICPIQLMNVCTGKEGKPTLAFQLAVDHFRRIYNCDKEILWSEMLESVRKDVECVNGILKGRFRF